MKKTIAIIGADEKAGAAVARELVTGCYKILLLGNETTSLELLLSELLATAPHADVEAVHCLVDASWEADVIVLAVPVCNEQEIAARIREVATGKTVISIINDEDVISGPELRERLPYSKVIRTLCGTPAEIAYAPVIDGESVKAFIERQ